MSAMASEDGGGEVKLATLNLSSATADDHI